MEQPCVSGSLASQDQLFGVCRSNSLKFPDIYIYTIYIVYVHVCAVFCGSLTSSKRMLLALRSTQFYLARTAVLKL